MTDSTADAPVLSPTVQGLLANAADALPDGGIAKQLADAERDGKQLRIKFGVDPTSADIHIGHCVVLGKLREFQDAGHLAVLIIGDYTARVGDPSQRSKSRPMVSGAEIDANAVTYAEQAMRILDPTKTEVRYNGEWLGSMTMDELFGLVSRSTIARLLERDDFAKRYAENAPITMLELLYPLLQGYDSVAIDADIELGGTDQLYNLLMGRFLQPSYDKPGQSVLTMPILTGTDGVEKMSKSLGNHIGITDTPEDMFGKTMSIPDEAMPEWFRLAAGLPNAEREQYIADLASGALQPNAAKRLLGRSIVARFYDAQAGIDAEERFNTIFQKGAIPDDVPELAIADVARNDAGKVFLPKLLVDHLGVPSTSEARRLLQQGGVKLDGDVLPGGELEVDPSALADKVLQVGKRKFVRVTG